MKHTIVIGSWGRDAVVVCQTCTGPQSQNGDVLLRSATEVPLVDVVAVIEEHTGEGAFRATIGGAPDSDDKPQPDAQRVAPPRKRADGGPSVREYLESKGEI